MESYGRAVSCRNELHPRPDRASRGPCEHERPAQDSGPSRPRQGIVIAHRTPGRPPKTSCKPIPAQRGTSRHFSGTRPLPNATTLRAAATIGKRPSAPDPRGVNTRNRVTGSEHEVCECRRYVDPRSRGTARGRAKPSAATPRLHDGNAQPRRCLAGRHRIFDEFGLS